MFSFIIYGIIVLLLLITICIIVYQRLHPVKNDYEKKLQEKIYTNIGIGCAFLIFAFLSLLAIETLATSTGAHPYRRSTSNPLGIPFIFGFIFFFPGLACLIGGIREMLKKRRGSKKK